MGNLACLYLSLSLLLSLLRFFELKKKFFFFVRNDFQIGTVITFTREPLMKGEGSVQLTSLLSKKVKKSVAFIVKIL